jgi:hypothetical protein
MSETNDFGRTKLPVWRRCHLTVRIPPSQGGYTGSIPVSATKPSGSSTYEQSLRNVLRGGGNQVARLGNIADFCVRF